MIEITDEVFEAAQDAWNNRKAGESSIRAIIAAVAPLIRAQALEEAALCCENVDDVCLDDGRWGDPPASLIADEIRALAKETTYD